MGEGDMCACLTSHVELVEEVVGLGHLTASHTKPLLLAIVGTEPPQRHLLLQKTGQVHSNPPQKHLEKITTDNTYQPLPPFHNYST